MPQALHFDSSTQSSLFPQAIDRISSVGARPPAMQSAIFDSMSYDGWMRQLHPTEHFRFLNNWDDHIAAQFALSPNAGREALARRSGYSRSTPVDRYARESVSAFKEAASSAVPNADRTGLATAIGRYVADEGAVDIERMSRSVGAMKHGVTADWLQEYCRANGFPIKRTVPAPPPVAGDAEVKELQALWDADPVDVGVPTSGLGDVSDLVPGPRQLTSSRQSAVFGAAGSDTDLSRAASIMHSESIPTSHSTGTNLGSSNYSHTVSTGQSPKRPRLALQPQSANPQLQQAEALLDQCLQQRPRMAPALLKGMLDHRFGSELSRLDIAMLMSSRGFTDPALF